MKYELRNEFIFNIKLIRARRFKFFIYFFFWQMTIDILICAGNGRLQLVLPREE